MKHNHRTAKPFFRMSLPGFFILMVATATLGQGTAQNISINNTSTYIGSGRYKWSVYIEADPSILKTIDHVEYRLRSTFRNPVRPIKEPKGGTYPFSTGDYALDSFNVSATVFFKDHRSQELPDYTVRLKDDRPNAGVKVISRTAIGEKSSKYMWGSDFQGQLEVREANIVGPHDDPFKVDIYVVQPGKGKSKPTRLRKDPIATHDLREGDNKLYFEFRNRKYVLIGVDFRRHLGTSKMDFEIYRID